MRGIAGAALSLVLFCTGCASVTQGTTHSLRIETETAKGEVIDDADCTLTNDHGTIHAQSGQTTPVRRSSKDLEITCSSKGLPDATARLISRANAGLAGNILIGGGIGALVDHNTGAAYTYPSWVRLMFGEHATFDRGQERDGVAMAVLGRIDAQAPAVVAYQRPQVAAASAPAAPPSLAPTTPAAIPADAAQTRRGDTFDYVITDHATGRSQTVILRADRIDGTQVFFNNSSRVEKLNGEVVRIEAAVAGELDQATPPGGWMAGGRLPKGSWPLSYSSIVPGSRMKYDLTANAGREHTLRTAAGEFRAIRIDLQGWVRNENTNGPVHARYQGTAWFAPALRRVVRFEAKARTSGNVGSSYFQIDETAELARIGRE